jgi:hypothetical protein
MLLEIIILVAKIWMLSVLSQICCVTWYKMENIYNVITGKN